MAASMLMLRWIRIYSLDQIVPKSERRRIVDGSKSGFRLHRFNRPMGINYPINWPDRIRNYLLGRRELGIPEDDVISHMREHLGGDYVHKALNSLDL